MFLVQAVQVQYADELFAADVTFVEVLHVGSDGVVAVRDVQFETVGIDAGSAEGVDILHHQIPCAATFDGRRVIARFQHFQGQGIRSTQLFASIRRELTHLIDLTVIRIFVSHGEHLVLVKSRFKRDISECAIERIFAAVQQSCRLDLLEIHTAFHAVEAVQSHTRLVDPAEIRLLDVRIEAVHLVIRSRFLVRAPVEVRVVARFS